MSNDKKTMNYTFRIPAGLIDAIDKDVEESDMYLNRTQWIIAAIREYLRVRTQDRVGGGGHV